MDKVTFYGYSDIGKVRTNNEDAWIVRNIWDEDHILAVVIDGVGGYDGGEVASALAKKSIQDYLERYPDGERIELLRQAVVYANNTIYSERKDSVQYGNMSCVLTAILVEVKNERVNMAHVGDTRLYQYSDDRLVKLSHDHSLVGYREEIGELTEEEAMHHPQRNVIGRDVGSTFMESNGNGYIEVDTFPLVSDSILLLCSDGLCDMVTSAQMCGILKKDVSLRDKVESLIKEANDAGGKDNVTVILVKADMAEVQVTQRINKTNAVMDNHIRDVKQGSDIGYSDVSVSKCKKRREIINVIIAIVIAYVLGYMSAFYKIFNNFVEWCVQWML